MSEIPTVHTETLSYQAGDTQCRGYLSRPKSMDGPRPGVLVFPEWWGVNDYLEQRARMLADLGYVALVADMYGEGRTAGNADEAGSMMTTVLEDMTTGTTRIHAAHAALNALPQVDTSRTAAIGYCFGGAMVLHAARIGMDLRAVVSFHGLLGAFHQAEPGGIKARILVCHGGEDEFVSPAEIDSFKQEMAAAGADLQFNVYPGARHGFTSEAATANAEKYGLPIGYDANADRQSWQDMQKLFAEALG